jgi:hypothetical protein
MILLSAPGPVLRVTLTMSLIYMVSALITAEDINRHIPVAQNSFIENSLNKNEPLKRKMFWPFNCSRGRRVFFLPTFQWIIPFDTHKGIGIKLPGPAIILR